MKLFIGISLIILNFLLGSIPWGLIIAKMRGIDIREHGSKNIGATNVMRTIGTKWAFLCFVLDFLKGFLIPFLFQIKLVPSEYALLVGNFYLAPALAGLCGVFGHCFSPFLKCRGGKGVSTGLGFIFAFSPLGGVFLFAVFFATVFFTKYISAGSLLGALSALLISGFESFSFHHPVLIRNGYLQNYDFIYFTAAVIVVLIIWLKHIPNIRRIILKTENKITKK